MRGKVSETGKESGHNSLLCALVDDILPKNIICLERPVTMVKQKKTSPEIITVALLKRVRKTV